MDRKSGSKRLQTHAQRLDDEDTDSLPGTAASVSSSASSFRIPGIMPSVRAHIPPSQAAIQHAAQAPSFARLFTPQLDDADTSFRSVGRGDSQPPVDWLAKHGPSPRDFLETTQGPSGHFRVQIPSLSTDSKLARTVSPLMSGARQATPSQLEEPLRPFTASSYHRSRLVTADGSIGSYVCAILENRGGNGREIGIASIERDTGTLQRGHT